MNIEQIFSHAFRALDVSSNGPQQPMPGHPALVERPSPCADIGTADVSNLRAAVYAHERFVERLYDLLPDRVDEAYDEVRAEYLAIHGPLR